MPERYASLKQGLVGAWIPSVSGSGLLLPDVSGYGNHGTLTNMASDDWVSSQYGRALDFDGVNDYISIPGTSFNFTDNFAISFWCNITSGRVPLTKGNMGSSGYGFDFGGFTAGQIEFLVLVNGQNYISRGFAYPGGWVHVCGMFTSRLAGTARNILYINGNQQSGTVISAGTVNSVSTNASPLIIGSLSDLSFYFSGRLDDVRAYNRILSTQEIRLLASEPGIGFKPNPAKKLSRFSQRFTYQPPKAKTYGVVRVKETDHANLREGLVGAWCPSISGSGNLLPDLSGYGNNGTLTNMAANDWVSAQYGRALDFDGSNDFVTIADANHLDVTGPVTLSMWVRGTSNANKVLAEKGVNGSLVMQPNGANQFYLLDGNASPVSVTGIGNLIFDGSWRHLCGLFDGTNRSLYVSGTAYVSTAMNTPTANAGAFVFGGRTGGVAAWTGQIDDVRIYNRALTPSEIRLLAQRPGIGLRQEQHRQTFYQTNTRAQNHSLISNMF